MFKKLLKIWAEFFPAREIEFDTTMFYVAHAIYKTNQKQGVTLSQIYVHLQRNTDKVITNAKWREMQDSLHDGQKFNFWVIIQANEKHYYKITPTGEEAYKNSLLGGEI